MPGPDSRLHLARENFCWFSFTNACWLKRFYWLDVFARATSCPPDVIPAKEDWPPKYDETALTCMHRFDFQFLLRSRNQTTVSMHINNSLLCRNNRVHIENSSKIKLEWLRYEYIILSSTSTSNFILFCRCGWIIKGRKKYLFV